MRIVFHKNLKGNFNEEDLPFVFSESYKNFINASHGNEYHLFYSGEYNAFLPVRRFSSGRFPLLQVLYPPVSLTGDRLGEAEEKSYLENFVGSVRTQKLGIRIIQPPTHAIFKSFPVQSESCSFGTYCIDLKKNEQELFNHIHPKHRNVIRNAEKQHAEIRWGKTNLQDFYSLYSETMKRSAMYCEPYEYFENVIKFKGEDNVLCGVVYSDNKPQGAIWVPFTLFSGYYLYGASSLNITLTGAINYLHWEAIKLLKKKGVKRYDFVGFRLSDVSGTKLEGIQNFKKRFGGDLVKGFLWKVDIDKVNCKIYDTLLMAKIKLNGSSAPFDIIDEELSKGQYGELDGEAKHSRVVVPPETLLINRVKNKFDKEKEEVLKHFRILKKQINQDFLVSDLEAAGIEKGDTIMVHSSLSKIGNVNGGSKTVIKALLEQLGTNGNLVMPSFSYIKTMEHTTQVDDYVFDPLSTPSVVGIIPEEFRKWQGVKRSIHPTHSVCALGPRAESITEGHLKSETNFGMNTPFHRIRELKGKAVGLCVNIGYTTIYHSAEDFFPDHFGRVYLPEPEMIKIVVDGKETVKSIYIHDPEFHRIRIDKNIMIEGWLRNHFREKGILHENAFGADIIWWMDTQKLFEELLLLSKKGITIYKVPGM